jgi:hypothetical protein
MQAYAGVGSRRTPIKFEIKMGDIAHYLQAHFTLRSGGCPGPDLWFEHGVTNGNSEIYLHKKGGITKNHPSPLYHVSDTALKMAAYFHPVWHKLGYTAKLLMGRNCYQVLGKDLNDPVKFLICYTPDGCEDGHYTTADTGGTGQAIRVASYLDIPIINMANKLWENKLATVLSNYGLDYDI